MVLSREDGNWGLGVWLQPAGARSSVSWVWDNQDATARSGPSIYLSGHSLFAWRRRNQNVTSFLWEISQLAASLQGALPLWLIISIKEQLWVIQKDQHTPFKKG